MKKRLVIIIEDGKKCLLKLTAKMESDAVIDNIC